MTYPLIGNYGRLREDDQSIQPWLRGLIVGNATAAVPSRRASSRRCCAGTMPAIAGIDTRLARQLRDRRSARVHHRAGSIARSRRARGARAVPRWEDQDFVGQVSPAEVTRVAAGRGRAARRHPRLRPQGEHRRNLRGAGRAYACSAYRDARPALAAEVDALVFSPGPVTRRARQAPVALAGGHR